MSVQVFENPEFELRFIPDGDSFRVEAPGLARALGLRDSYALVRSVPDADKGYTLVRTPGGGQRIWHLSEPGFYRVLGQRQTARIKDAGVRDKVARFQNWVYGEVLPSIRRTGSYQPTAIAARLAEIAHKELVVSTSARVLAYHRWNKPEKGMEAFESVCIQLELDFRPLSAAADAPREIASGEADR